jgi:hypothetical protein
MSLLSALRYYETREQNDALQDAEKDEMKQLRLRY